MISNLGKILVLGIAAAFVAVAACGDSSTAPHPGGSIAGDVTLEGRGLDGVTVSLSTGMTVATTTHGSFRFDGIAPGTYEVSISGYPAHVAFGATSMPVTIGTEGGRATVAFGASSTDRDALVALYNATDGPNWTDTTNWLTDAPLDDWYGVTTDASGRVTSLWLQENNLRGTIPAAIGGLTRLEVLALFRDPGLTGPIPQEIGNLADLRLLALGGNSLTGAIPPELGNLTELTGLYLWGNSLTGAIPPELGNLSNLEALQLDGPGVAAAASADATPGGRQPRAAADPLVPGLSVPQRFQEQADNQEGVAFAASRNDVGLTGPIPTEIGNLKNLTLLTLGHNRLTGAIPAEIGNLTKLEDFSVRSNQLTGTIPAVLGSLTDLTLLMVEGNQLTGSIPAELANLSNLEILWAGNNDLSGTIPPTLGNLGKLTHLGLHDNSLTGTIPPSLGNLTSLVQLALSRNRLAGPIPPELGNLGNLEILYLNQNRLDGGIPPELGDLSSLVSLSVRDNELTGAIPAEVGNLSNLVRLWVHRNPLSGPLPLDMTKLANLSLFNFSDTRLCVPDNQAFKSWLQSVQDVTRSGLDCGATSGDRDVLVALYNATDGPNWTNNTNWLTSAPLGDWYGVETDASERVVGLEFEGNNLSGTIPPELGRLASLETLVLVDSLLTGSIPRELGNLANLVTLGLGFSPLTGSIPREFGDLANLETLILAGTGVSGSIPPELGNLARLGFLNLSYNQLSGPIPSAIGALSNLTYLYLGDNQLTGSIPAEIGSLTSLRELRFGGNPSLSGPIPSEIGNLASLEWLGLWNTGVTGKIPPEIGRLTELRTLGIVDASLTGPIPPQIGDLANLELLNIAGNALTSAIPPEIGNLARLQSLNLSRNDLSGPIPDSFLALQSLDNFYADAHNCIPGTAAFAAWLQRIANHGATLCNAADRAALVRLYEATDGPNWTKWDNWLDDNVPLDDWYGVTTDASGRVVGLDLPENNLTGPIPPEIGNLARLTTLVLVGNDLSGRIPPELGDLASLENLNLWGSGVGGPIPRELGNLTNLARLKLTYNDLTGPIPAELGNLAKLTQLELEANDLTGPIPSELGNLADLTRLKLHANNLTGPIPDRFLQLQQLAIFSADIHNCVPATTAFTAWLQRIPGSDATLCTAADKAVLVGLYQATDGPNWTNWTNWLDDVPLGDWHGVTTDASGRVVGLELLENNLTGPIPREIGNLTNLQTLILGRNNLTGPIPPELGKLASLTTLALFVNDLSGPIPPEFGNLGSMRDMNLWGNRLSGPIPSELGSLALMWQLSLAANELTGPIPPELGNLGDALVVLEFHQNNLSGPIPDSFLRLQRLDRFNADVHNCVPATDAFTAWLQRIANRGATLCSDADRTALEALYHATGGPNWTRWSNWLTNAPLRDWQGVTTDASGRVRRLDLDSNNLSGSIPRELAALSELVYLNLSRNRLTGSIPRELGNLASLSSLLITANRLTGSIPREIGHLANLSQLRLSANSLTGSIPSELGSLANLLVLHLLRNNLSGPIPESFLELGRLVSFHADSFNCVVATAAFTAWRDGIQDSGATLCGPDKTALVTLYRATDGPNWTEKNTNWLTNAPLGDWEGVFTDASGRVILLVLEAWGLTGSIPPEIDRLAHLQSLRLPHNNLSGTLPPELGGLANLRRLNLRNNQISGPIPPELADLANLRQLLLDGNQFSGSVPFQLINLDNLQELRLGGNQLSGPIPPHLGFFPRLEVLDLRANELTGSIPWEFGDLANLELLGLSGNRLTGPIPPELGNLTNLKWLFIHANDLAGSIPPELGRMSSLESAYFSDNRQLSGALPAALTALSNLEALFAVGTDLCAPQDPRFQAWLLGVHRRRIVPCIAADPPMAYLTQAVQSREFPVPLVAGEKALLRVFPTTTRENGAYIPAIRAYFFNSSWGASARIIDIPGKTVYIPTDVDEGNLEKSANTEIPGILVQPGLEMVIEVDPNRTLDPLLGVTKRIPETGRLAVNVRPMPPFDLTLIPFIWRKDPNRSIIDLVDAVAADPANHELLWHTRTLLPIDSLKVTAHDSVFTDVNNANDLLRETKAIRAAEKGRGHYMGIMPGPLTGRYRGLAGIGGRSSFSVPFAAVVAHELGHNLNLLHAPCGGARGVDSNYPYGDGSIGAWGYDFRDGGRLVEPSTPDLMSYCDAWDPPWEWVSDYHFTNAFGFRFNDPANVGSAAQALLLWGGVGSDDTPFLEPAFVVDAPPLLPDSTGEYRMTGRAGNGAELFSLSFTMPDVADGDGSSSFAFILPVRPGWERNLTSITLSGPRGQFTLDADSDLPMAILRNPRNGQVRGILRDSPPDTQMAADAAVVGARGLEILFSRGLPGADAWRR